MIENINDLFLEGTADYTGQACSKGVPYRENRVFKM